MLADLRYACRSLLRVPALSAVIVFSLGAGIGINTVVFSWIQARILDPIPGVPGGGSVRLIEPRSPAGLYTGASWPEFEDMRNRLETFDAVFASRTAPFYLGEPGAVVRVFGLLVSDNYFTALGVAPAVGRFFRPEDVTAPDREPVAVISHSIWTTRFGGTPDVLQKTVRINGAQLQVIGVAPDAFQGTTAGLQFDVWLPATAAGTATAGRRELTDRSIRGYSVMGRLKAGLTPPQAQLELDGLMRELAVSYPATNDRITAEVLPFHQSPRGPQRMLNVALTVLQGMMLLLLCAVCGNVANLLLARASARQKEIGIRLSLGARPWRIATLLLTESVLLAILGSGLGVAIAIWGTQGLLILPMTGVPIRFQTRIDLVGLAFAVGLGLVAGLLAGLAPALHLARVDPQTAYRSGVQSSGRSRLRSGLMAAQVALAIVVLIVAGLFFRALMESRTTDPGFRRDGTLLAAYDLSGREVDATFTRTLATRTLTRLGSLPIVESVAVASSVPLDIHGLPSRMFTVEGHTPADVGYDEALVNTVTPGYFELMGIRVVGGRDFAAMTDPSSTKEAVVNEEFVRRYAAAGEPIGRRISTRGGPFTIVGVVANSLYNAFGEPPTPAIYFSYRDVPQGRGEIHVRLRGGGTTSAGGEIGRAMREVDADLPVFNVRSMHQHIDTNLIFRRIPAQMFSALGPMLLALAAIGIYAVVSYSVTLRTREIGVRLAVGSTASRVVGELVVENLTVAALGGLAGWGLAFILARELADPGVMSGAVFAIVPAILLSVAALACWLPARRAAAVDPAITLRAE